LGLRNVGEADFSAGTRGAGKKRVTRPKRASHWSDGEVVDDVVVALLGIGHGEAGVDLQ
jgi:hypothetical protein